MRQPMKSQFCFSGRLPIQAQRVYCRLLGLGSRGRQVVRNGWPPLLMVSHLLCHTHGEAAEPARASAVSERLHQCFQSYLETRFALDPYYATLRGEHRYNHLFVNTWSPAWIAQTVALEEGALACALALPAHGLSGRDRVDRQVFLFHRRKRLDYYHYPGWLLPISPVSSRLNNFARMGSGSYYFPFDTVHDYDSWLARVSAAGPWFAQLIHNLRAGVDAGVVHPVAVARRLLPQVEAHIVDDVEDSVYFRPIANMPHDFTPAQRRRLSAAYRQMIETQLLPAYRRIAAFLRDEYIPAARAGTAWRDLPEGEAWYRQLVRYYTGADHSPEVVHQWGLAQMALLQNAGSGAAAGSTPLLASVAGQRQSARYFDNAEQLLEAYRSLLPRAEAVLGAHFDIRPTTRLEIRPVERYRSASAARASYRRPPPDLSGPGIVYINTHDLRAQPRADVQTLFLHEAIPGHHLQMALMLEMEALPAIRRLETDTAFKEGWALYAQSLGPGMGFYEAPAQQLAYVDSQRLRAARLVVDTGLHALGWSRAQAVAYMLRNTNRSVSNVQVEVDRYIARPAQALSYMVGYLELVRLRRDAQLALGEHFDIKAFHRVLLEDGALPLAVLADKVNDWITAQSLVAR